MPVQYRTLTGLKKTDPNAELLIRDLVQAANALETKVDKKVDAQAVPTIVRGVILGGQSTGTDTGITQLTGDGTAGPGDGSQVFTLANSGVAAGTYGDATHVPQVTFDAKGRATAAANVAITDNSWIPLVDGSEPPNFITDGAGVLILVAYP